MGENSGWTGACVIRRQANDYRQKPSQSKQKVSQIPGFWGAGDYKVLDVHRYKGWLRAQQFLLWRCERGSALYLGRSRCQAGADCAFRDRQRHGCRCRAYRDVFTACPGRHNPRLRILASKDQNENCVRACGGGAASDQQWRAWWVARPMMVRKAQVASLPLTVPQGSTHANVAAARMPQLIEKIPLSFATL